MGTVRTPSTAVDLDRYPFHDADLIANAHRAFVDEGVCILPGFVRADAVDELVRECAALAPLAHRSHVRGTPYLAPPATDRPADHPLRALVDNRLEVVAYDQFPDGSLLRALYEWDDLLRFVAAVLGVDELHRYADPFGALNLAVMREGDVLGWHFDMTDFVVSIAVQSSTRGGDFLNAKQIRTVDDERFADVASVLADGAASPLVRLEPMMPGTLMLFNGRRSLHQVSEVGGDVPRYVALLAYDTRPGTDSTDLLKLTRYGRLPGGRVTA
uniref:Fe2OG dioxygenase domain-containing protein n=1 Tax=uncultured bacterium A1Q1_fos_515 TaxID=1256581 RepID=L7VUY7_9BACT|nr:hypothetical protein [uncultured bacterium A1Q1_fos_515]